MTKEEQGAVMRTSADAAKQYPDALAPSGDLTSPAPANELIAMQPRSIFEITRDLSQKFPKLEKQKEQGGTTLSFIPWYHCNRLLSHYTNHLWVYRIVDRKIMKRENDRPVTERKQVNGRWTQVPTGEREVLTDTWLSVLVEISILTNEGWITRQGEGFETMDKTTYGDAQSVSESMAFRRAGARFGLGLYLYI